MATLTNNIAPSNGYKLTITQTQIGDYNVTNNATVERITGSIGRNGSTYTSQWGSSTNTLTIKDATTGTTIATYNPTTAYNLINNTSQQIFSYDVTIPHNPDGSKAITISWSFNGNVAGQYNPNGSVSGNATLTTIPRASSITVSNADIGSATSIIINRASSSFTHTLRYSFQSVLSGTITDKTTNTVVGWTVPTSFYQYTTDVKQANCIVYCDTYNGNTLIGTTSYVFACIVNETLNKPSVSLSLIDGNPTTVALTGNNKKIVRGYSYGQATWIATAKNYATINNKRINSSEIGGTLNPVPFSNMTTNILTLTATDSRGFSSSVSTTDTTNPLVNYIPLTVDVNFKRVQPTTGEVSIDFSGNYFNQNFGIVQNTLALSWKYRIAGSITWTDGGTFTLNTHYKISGNTFYSGTGSSKSAISLGSSFTYTNSYEFALFYQDKLINTYQAKPITKGEPVFWWNKLKFFVNKTLTVKNQYGTFDISEANWGNSTSLSDYASGVNKLVTSGWFPISGDSAMPTTGAYMLQVMCKNPDYYVKQIAYGRESHDIYQRYRTGSSSWSGWFMVMSSGLMQTLQYQNVQFGVASLSELQTYLVNTAPAGCYNMQVNQNGGVYGIVVSKASNSYLSFIQFSYGINAIQYRYNNGTWTSYQL